MGTSKSNPGAGPGSPLIPPWADDGSPPPPPLPDRFRAFRSALGKAARSRASEDFGTALRHYASKATGGGGTAAITMRSRSFNFLALAAVAASVVAEVTDTNLVPLIVPENGFIALNAPLTPRRVGSLSTRTTHPYFLGKIQNVFDQIGIPATISNPYEFKTKGEMFRECLNPLALQSAAPQTMSCSNWKRKGHACGRCVPCLIRRASFEFAGVADTSIYAEPLTQGAEMGDDLLAVLTAILRARETPTRAIASRSGPLPLDSHLRSQYEGVVRRGLDEMECFLLARGIA